MRKISLLVAFLLATPALGQNVQQFGTPTRNHVPVWNSSGVIADGGSSADSPISSIGVTNNGGAGFCVNSDRASAAGRNQLCFGAQTSGPAFVSLQNFGTATPQGLNFIVNGVTSSFVTIPAGIPQAHVAAFGSGNALQDTGIVANAGSITTGTWLASVLAISVGGTNCSAASGTCLDNITGFASTGYMKRTGAGTYSFPTQIPVSTDISGLGTGVATALALNVGSAGAPVVFNGALGTPSSGTLTSATGLPISTGLTGAGTGVLTALGVNVGTAGAFVTNGGALGTPSSGDATNIVNLNATNLSTGNVADARMPNTAWTTFTPTVTCGTATFTTTSARAKTWGKVTHFELDATFTALGTCTVAVSFTVPTTAQSGGGGGGREQNNSGKGIGCSVAASSAIMICAKGDATNWINGERLVVSGVYENQ